MAALGTALDARPESTATIPREPRRVPAEPSWFRRSWPLLALAAGAVAVTLLSRHLIYPAFSWNRDEATYLWQMDALRDLRIFGSDGGAPSFFWPWLTGLRGAGFFSQYTIGWPAFLLAIDSIFGSPELALAVSTVLAVLGTHVFTLELTKDRQLALVSATLMLASPIIVIQSGVYLAYLFSLGLGLFFGAALLAGMRQGSRPLLLGAGALLGWILLTRPFDAVLWGLPLFAYAAVVSWRKWRPLWRAVLWTGVAFAPFVVLTLLYNRRVSGSFTQFPITAKDPLDTFGFGPRRLMPIADIFDYSVGRAVRSVGHNLRTLPPFFVGGWVGAALAFVGLWLRRRDRTTIALLGIAIAFPAGYFFFWGNLLSSRAASLAGPVYYVPLYAPACVFLATVLIAAWRRRRGLGVALAVLLAALTVPYAVSKIGPNHRISEAQEPWKDATRPIEGDALVIVENSGPYLMHLNPYSLNPPDLDGRILFAVDRGPENIDLITSHPGRAPYFIRTTDPRFDDPVAYHDAPLPRISLVPLQIVRGQTMTLRARVTNTSGEPAVVAYLQVGDRVEQRTLATNSSRGDTFVTEWRIAPANSPAAAEPGVIPVGESLGNARIGVGTASVPEQALASRQLVEEVAFRVDEQAAELALLYPGRTFTAKPSDNGLDLTQVANLRALDVELVANR